MEWVANHNVIDVTGFALRKPAQIEIDTRQSMFDPDRGVERDGSLREFLPI